ncbi:MAG: hypothetical protein K6347_06845, partial [Campylobacterales bacterium]
RIQEMRPDESIVDEMVRGPFTYFRHARRFISVGEGITRMEEQLVVVLPLGSLGRIFEGFVRREMTAMFAWRHHATKQLLEQKC